MQKSSLQWELHSSYTVNKPYLVSRIETFLVLWDTYLKLLLIINILPIINYCLDGNPTPFSIRLEL